MTVTQAPGVVPAWSSAPRGEEAGPRHVLRREHWGSLVYDRETCQYVPYDADATALLLSDRPKTSEERAFLASLRAEGLSELRVVEDRSHPDRVSAPLTVYLGATEGCNLACAHCQVDAPRGAARPMPRARLEALFREMRDLGCLQASVSGGEPLLHPELLPALEVAARLGINVFLTTNGTTVDEALADALADLPLRSVNVSFDGPDAEAHDLVRGRGAFARARRGVERLARRRPCGIVTTLTRASVLRARELLRLAEEVGAAALVVRPALPVGRAAAQAPGLVPDQASFLEAVDELLRLAPGSPVRVLVPPRVPHQATTAQVLERFGCVAGNLVCSVLADGSVSPCALLGDGFVAGNLARASLHALWATGAPFERLRGLEGNEDCWTCKHYDRCGGGCRARALAAGRELDAPDPWCQREPVDP